MDQLALCDLGKEYSSSSHFIKDPYRNLPVRTAPGDTPKVQTPLGLGFCGERPRGAASPQQLSVPPAAFAGDKSRTQEPVPHPLPGERPVLQCPASR